MSPMATTGTHPDGREAVRVIDERIVHRDPHAYCAHPHMTVTAAGTWLLVFNRTIRRPVVLHPPQDPEFRNVLMRSTDEGRTWSAPMVVPGYGFSGIECAGLTALADGRVLLNQWRFGWVPLGDAERSDAPADLVRPERLMAGLIGSTELAGFSGRATAAELAAAFPWARGPGETFVHVSDDDGRSFRIGEPIATAPYSGGYGMRGALELSDGTLVLPLSDVPRYEAIFVVRSADRGRTWSAPIPVAAGAGHEFEEPAGLVLDDGRLLLMLRDNATRILHATTSDDGGLSWSPAAPTGIATYPADLLRLADGRAVCVTGRREPPFGIVLHVSPDGGRTWPADRPVTVRDDLPDHDLGYPTVAERADGSLVVVYYGRDADGVTAIHQTTVRLD